MNYELLLKLKDAGFPQKNKNFCDGCSNPKCRINEYENSKPDYDPTLEELIEACMSYFKESRKDEFYLIYKARHGWSAGIRSWLIKDQMYSDELGDEVYSSTPKEAVANLYLELNKK